jgi:hypothetical protein
LALQRQELTECNCGTAAPAEHDDGRGGKLCRACLLILLFLIPLEKEKCLKLLIKNKE